MIRPLLLAVLLLGVTPTVAASSLTPTEVMDRIAETGPDETLNQLYRDEGEWADLLRRISTGLRPWLEIANKLRAFSDAGITNELGLAVAEGLEHRPGNVLRIAVPSFEIGIVCGAPDVDDPRYDSYGRSIHAIEKRERKVRAIEDPRLKQRQTECLAKLRKARVDIARFHNVQTDQPPN